MSTMKRCISLLLVLGIILGVLVPATQAAPVEETASVNTDNVTIEGTNGFGNLLSQEITESQEEAEAAEADYPNGYTVTDLVIEGNIATVTYDTMEEATLVVALYTEDGMQMLNSTTATVSPDATEAELIFEGNMPEYFMASAYLLDQYDYSPLCAPYDTPMYTQEMQELLASTVDDYDSKMVLNLDADATKNFAVFADSTILIEPADGLNTVVSVDDENGIYIIENADEQILSLHTGDVFAYPYGENEILIAKVAELIVDETMVIITSGDLELTEVFDQVKIIGAGDDSNLTVDNSATQEGVVCKKNPEATLLSVVEPMNSNSSEASASIDISFEGIKLGDSNANIQMTGSGTLTLTLGIEYYVTKSYQRIEIRGEANLKGTIGITGAVESPINLGHFAFDIIPTVLHLGTDINFVIKVEGKVETTLTIGVKMGFIIDHGDQGWEKDGYCTPELKVETKFEGTLFFGLELEPSAKILYGVLADISLTVKGGLEYTLERDIYPKTSNDEHHLCYKCYSGEIKLKATLECSAKFLKNKKLSIKANILELAEKVDDIYYTVGMSSFKHGHCPNLSYRLTATVVDIYGNPIEGASIIVSDYCANTDRFGIAFLYLPTAEYVVTVTLGENTHKQSIYMDSAQKIKVRMSVDGSFIGDTKNIFDYGTFEEAVDYGSIKKSGYYGNNIRWTLYNSGTLTIEGQGKMGSASLNGVPWADYRSLIKEIVIYDGVTYIGGSVFQFCENLYSVKIPDSVTEIGAYAFRNCTSLKSITIPDSVTNTWGYIFQDCTSLSDVTLGNSLTDIYDGMFLNCNSLTSIVIPDSVTSIGKQAFHECDNLNSVTIGKGVSNIGENAFRWCKNLKTIIFTGNAPKFGSYVFRYVTATAYYPANNSTWTSSVRKNYDGKITWKPYNSLADIPLSVKPISAVELSTNDEMTGIAPQAVYPGDYSTRVTEDYTLKTASFSNLVPNQQYVLFSMIDVSTQDPLVPSNLLYVDQAVAEADGTLTFDYVQREVHDVSYVFVCGASNKDLKNAEISFPEMSADGALQVVNPTIIYDGKLLIEGQDYVVVGTVDFSEAGEYTCYIRGIRNYTGIVECDYTVIGHSHSFTNFISDENASCTNDGTMTAKCDSCDAIKTIVDEGSALGHSFGEWIVIQEPTTLKDGLEERSCVRCEHTEQRSIAKLENPFNDVASGSFYYEPVMWAIENGITNGTSATTFGPNDQCMRAHVVTFLWRAVGSPEPTRTDNPFVDVKPSDFYYKPVLWALENGITSGMDATHFGPTSYCNRAQVVTFLYRTMGNPDVGATANPFTDVAAGSFYEKPVLWAVENGVTAGLSATSFGPNSICNRAQIVTFLYRAFVD